MDPKVLVAAIAAGASIVAATVSLAGVVVSVLYSRDTQRHLARLQAELEETKSKRSARRDYRYEARKRLYAECEPSIFQMVEACDHGRQRIGRLLNAAIETNSDELRLSSLYRLLLPAVVFAGLRERLTVFDLSLEPRIYLQYELGKLITTTYSDDRTLAASGPDPLVYKPREAAPAGAPAEPKIYAPQGISAEHVDAFAAAASSQIDGARVPTSFPVLQRAYRERQADVLQPVLNLDYLFRGFSSSSRPVLCRMLHAQVILFDLMVQTRTYRKTDWARSLRFEDPESFSKLKCSHDTCHQAAIDYLRPKLSRIYGRVCPH